MREDWSTLKKLIWLRGSLAGGAAPILKTITGALLHITDALAKPAHELVAVLKPVQSGTGDPSPDNVRPISGWTGVTVYDNAIPEEYQKVEYLESSGNQYINMFPNDPAPNPVSYLKIRINGTLVSKTSSETGLFGGKPSITYGAGSPTLFIPTDSNVLQSWCGGYTQFNSGLSIAVGTRYVIESSWSTGSGRMISIDGISNTGNQSNTEMATDVKRHFCLFRDGVRSTGSASSSLRVYSFVMTIDDLIVRNLVPCYRKSDNEPGMYDTVTGTFFTNVGTGVFVLGSNVTGGTTLPINWQTEAGTIYGGTVTLNEDGSADVVSEYGIADISTLPWDSRTYTDRWISWTRPADMAVDYITSDSQTRLDGFCDKLLVTAFSNTATQNYSIGMRTSGKPLVARTDGTHDVSPIGTLVYRLSTPQTYHFDNVGQLQLFLGENNIWVDASDDLTLTYYADGNVSDAEALNTLLGGAYTPGDVSDREALNILLGD